MSIIAPITKWARVASTPLDVHFQPGEHDVVCSKLGSYRTFVDHRTHPHVGNRNFASRVIDEHLDLYTQTKDNLLKGRITVAIVNLVRRQSPNGGFVSYCDTAQRYFEIGDKQARAEVKRAIRDAITYKAQFNKEIVALAAKFEPGKYDVICSPESEHYANPHFQQVIQVHLERYKNAKKDPEHADEKKSIIDWVIFTIRRQSPNGGFVRFCDSKQCYFEVGDVRAREEVELAFCQASSYKARTKGVPLPASFQPGRHDVICFPSPLAADHLGNVSFRRVIEGQLSRYMRASRKITERNEITDLVVYIIRSRSPSGGFVRFCEKSKCYIKVADTRARQEVSLAFRQAMDDIKVVRESSSKASYPKKETTNFKPGEHDVICSNTSDAIHHVGNTKYFAKIIIEHVERYMYDKRKSILAVLDLVQRQSPNGGFVRYCGKNRCYVQVSDAIARRKISQALLRQATTMTGQPKGHVVLQAGAHDTVPRVLCQASNADGQPLGYIAGSESSSVLSTATTEETFEAGLPVQAVPFEELIPLASNFQLGEHDVICANTSYAVHHNEKNQYYRNTIYEHTEPYRQAHFEDDKNTIMDSVITRIRRRSPEGGFLRFDEKTKSYGKVGDGPARDKVGRALRQAIGENEDDDDGQPEAVKTPMLQTAVHEEIAPLASGFQPGEYDVICSTPSEFALLHVGNQNYRNVIYEHVELYKKAQSKDDRSLIISGVIALIQYRSPNGGFVRFCDKSKCYINVGETRARQEVSLAFHQVVSCGGCEPKGNGLEDDSTSTVSTTEKETEDSTSTVPTIEKETEASTSTVPTIEKETEASPSTVPTIEKETEDATSTVPTIEKEAIWTKTSRKKVIPLDASFRPGENDVLCSNKTDAVHHAGNIQFQKVVDDHVARYREAHSQSDKSKIILSVISLIRRRSPAGGFVRFCEENKCYFKVGDGPVRNKVRRALRNAVDFAANTGDCNDEMVPFASNFQPGEHDVICSKTLYAVHHNGKKFQKVIGDHLEQYKRFQPHDAKKRRMVVSIVDMVRRQSPNGGFVRFCSKTKCYVKMGDTIARHHVSEAFQDAIEGQQKGSAAREASDGIPSVWEAAIETMTFQTLQPPTPDATPPMSKFRPGEYDVICSKTSYTDQHAGNVNFRGVIDAHLHRYRQALKRKKKGEKTRIITLILGIIHRRSPNGGFVRFCRKNGRYVKASEINARRVVVCAFREANIAFGSQTKDHEVKESLSNFPPIWKEAIGTMTFPSIDKKPVEAFCDDISISSRTSFDMEDMESTDISNSDSLDPSELQMVLGEDEHDEYTLQDHFEDFVEDDDLMQLA